MANKHVGARAQYTRYGGVNTGLLGMFLNRADVMENALRRAYGRDIQRGREGLALSSQLFDKRLGLRRGMSEAELALRRKMFEGTMAQRWARFRAMQPSGLEMALTAGLPLARGGLMGYLHGRMGNQYSKQMEDMLARYTTGLYNQSVNLSTQAFNPYSPRPFSGLRQPNIQPFDPAQWGY